MRNDIEPGYEGPQAPWNGKSPLNGLKVSLFCLMAMPSLCAQTIVGIKKAGEDEVVEGKFISEEIDGISWSYCVQGGKAEVCYDASLGAAIKKTTSGYITVPSELTGITVSSIGEKAFAGCKRIKGTTIPSSVTNIGVGAFQKCTGLEEVVIYGELKEIAESTFERCSSLVDIDIPGSVTNIGEKAFKNCSDLTDITVPDNVRRIGDHAFAYCVSLENVEFPEVVESIGYRAFSSCKSLATLTLPDSLVRIGERAFSDCLSLTNVSISKSVTHIGRNAFRRCRKLATLTVDGRNPRFSVRNGLLCNKNGSEVVMCPGSLSEVEIPDGTICISEYAFGTNDVLQKIVIPGSVEYIGAGAFSECTALSEVCLSKSYAGPTNIFPSGATITQHSRARVTIGGVSGFVNVIASVFEDHEDSRLEQEIDDAAKLVAFKTWLESRSDSFVEWFNDSANAWLSYALDTDSPILNAPVGKDFRIDGFMQNPGTDGYGLSVLVVGIRVGENATPDNLAKVLKVECSTELVPEKFSSENVRTEFDQPDDGKIKVTATPVAKEGEEGAERPRSLFMRVKMKQSDI